VPTGADPTALLSVCSGDVGNASSHIDVTAARFGRDTTGRKEDGACTVVDEAHKVTLRLRQDVADDLLSLKVQHADHASHRRQRWQPARMPQGARGAAH
jgi:hypothetical protein